MAITKIAEVTVGAGGAASIDFTSIPGTYADLMVVCSIRSTQAAVTAYTVMSINSSQANFSERNLYGNGSSVGSGTSPANYSGEIVGASATSNTFSNQTIYIPNYASSTNKSISFDSVGENNAINANQSLAAVLWSQTAAITVFSIISTSGTFVQYSSATLYGILKGSSGGVTVA